MHGLRCAGNKIPEQGAIWKIVDRRRGECSDGFREPHSVPQEKDGNLVAQEIENTVFGIKLGGKSPDITATIWSVLGSYHKGKTGESGGALSGILEKTGFGILAHGLIGLKISKSAVPLDVQDSLQRFMVDEGRECLM